MTVKRGIPVELSHIKLTRAAIQVTSPYAVASLTSEMQNPVHVLTRSERTMKRAFDIVFSLLILMLTFPLFIVIAIAVKVDSRGSIIFRQTRVGQHERRFTMYKFRSMVENADEIVAPSHAGEYLKRPDDPRVTRIGRILRRTSLDELPQFFNVLIGDMSVVGPRPEVLWIAEQYEPWQQLRTTVPQGITGWWQVTGRAANPLQNNVKFDLYYIRHYSFWFDLRIVAMTPLCVLTGYGAY